MNQDICEKIINTFIKSKTLKDEIKKTNWHFSDLDLLALVNSFSKNYNQKLEFLNLMVENTKSSNIKNIAIDVIDYQKKVFEEFIKPTENAIYHIIVQEKPRAIEEHYVSKTYEDAVNVIKSYTENYNIHDLDSRFEIYKRKLMNPQKPKDIEDEYIGRCSFNNKLMLIEVFVEKMFRKNKSENKLDNHWIKYPPFIHARDLVSYLADWETFHIDDGLNSGKIEGERKLYGINLFDMYQSFDEIFNYSAQIQLLDIPYVKERRIDVNRQII